MNPMQAREELESKMGGAIANSTNAFGGPAIMARGPLYRAQAQVYGAELQQKQMANQAVVAMNEMSRQPDFAAQDPRTGILSINPKYAAHYANLQSIAGGNFSSAVFDNANASANKIYDTSNKEIKMALPGGGETVMLGANDSRRLPAPGIVPPQGGPNSQGGPQVSPPPSQGIVPQQSPGGPSTQPSSPGILPPGSSLSPGNIPGGNIQLTPGGQTVLSTGNPKALGELNDSLTSLNLAQRSAQGVLDRNQMASANDPYARNSWTQLLNHYTGIPDANAESNEKELITNGDPGAVARQQRRQLQVGEVAEGAKNLTSRVTEKELALIQSGMPDKGASPLLWQQHLSRIVALDDAKKQLIQQSIQNGGYPLANQNQDAIITQAFHAHGLDENGNLPALGSQPGQTPASQGGIVPQAPQAAPQAPPTSGIVPPSPTAPSQPQMPQQSAPTQGSMPASIAQQGGGIVPPKQDPSAIMQQAQAAIAAGADKGAVMQRLQGMGIQGIQ